MGRRIASILIAAAPLFTGTASSAPDDASAYPVVIELFTSQGRTSCPPADEEFSRLAEREDVITLSLHVDYWDYLGWKDEFGSPLNTERQRAYAKAMGERMIYTPQMVFQGREHTVGSQRDMIEAAILRQSETHPGAHVEIQQDGTALTVSISPGAAETSHPGARVALAYYRSHEQVSIPGGENRGLTIDYRNIVIDWAHLGEWTGEETTFSATRPPDADGAAVIVQDGEAGPIIAARRIAFQ